MQNYKFFSILQNRLFIIPELIHGNVNWRNPSYDKSLPEVMKDLKVLVKEKTDRSMMQTVLAESLGMERGTPKQDTGVESLSAIEYKENMAKEHVRKLQEEIEESKEKYREIR